MGICGLTTFIAKNSDKYLQDYELHDTYLIIDGNNLASHLYLWHSNCYDCFGGDYDKYAKTIEYFFDLLSRCNVTPLVVLDGCYETKKLKTIYQRIRSRVNAAGNLNSLTEGSVKLFPLFTRDLFTDVIRRLNVKIVRCDFEADLEMANLANTLHCPVLSYDSDFYVLDIMYVPFSTVNLVIDKNNKNRYKYIPCKIYRVERFLRMMGGLKKEVLPLLGTILGNDYVNVSVFQSFYNHIKLPKRNICTRTEQQRRIVAVTQWLKNESYETAVKKILGRVKKEQRKLIYDEIRKVDEIYTKSESKYLDVLNVRYISSKESKQSNSLTVDLEELNDHEDANEVEEDANEVEEDETSNEEADAIINEPIEEKNEYDLPDWFVDKYRRGFFPGWYMDLAIRNLYFHVPQLEDYNDETSHSISTKLLRAMQKILSYGKNRRLIYVTRNGKSSKKLYLNQDERSLLTLDEIPLVSVKQLEKTFFEIVEISINFYEIIDEWKLLFVSIIYWINNSKSLVNQSHIYALCLGMIFIYYTEYTALYNKGSIKVNKRFNDNKKLPLKQDITVEAKDYVSLLKQTIDYFDMDEKIQRNHRNYDITIVSAFAKFQSSFYYIKNVNLLLNCPLKDAVISDFYNGTYFYNLCVNFLKRTDLDNYVNVLLRESKNLLNLFLFFINSIKLNVEEDIKRVSVKKRRKKRNKTPKEKVVDEVVEESDDEDIFDVNNRFSLLKLC